MRKRIAIVGGGVTGMSAARMLRADMEVKIFEGEGKTGGLIRCERAEGSLFHICGGHVFNSKNKAVLEWMWGICDRDGEYAKAERNSVVFMPDGLTVPYPIEDHVYMFGAEVQKKFIGEMRERIRRGDGGERSFAEFLEGRFGRTLYELYFEPYNRKVWRRDLSRVPLTWLEGKLPMPTVEEMIYNNMNHVAEKEFVHSTFYYHQKRGSQAIADKLAEGTNVECDHRVTRLRKEGEKWLVDGEPFDKVLFCGNIKELPSMVGGEGGEVALMEGYEEAIERLEWHGTTAVFCEIDRTDYSWIYLPSSEYESHRIICTGNFAASNNAATLPPDRITATVEFTDSITLADIEENLRKMPLHPRYITHHYSPYTYPIQDGETRQMIASLKQRLEAEGLYVAGRFAEWEYYNMDAAIAAAMRVSSDIKEQV